MNAAALTGLVILYERFVLELLAAAVTGILCGYTSYNLGIVFGFNYF